MRPQAKHETAAGEAGCVCVCVHEQGDKVGVDAFETLQRPLCVSPRLTNLI